MAEEDFDKRHMHGISESVANFHKQMNADEIALNERLLDGQSSLCAFCGKEMGPQFCCSICRKKYESSHRRCNHCEQMIAPNRTIYLKNDKPFCSLACRSSAPDEEYGYPEGRGARGRKSRARGRKSRARGKKSRARGRKSRRR